MGEPEVADATRRTRLANERTYLAWLRSALTALAVAIGAGKIVPGVADVAQWPFELLGAGFALIYVTFALLYWIAWRKRIEEFAAPVRHLAVHQDHLVAVTERDRPLLDGALLRSFTWTGTRDEIRARLGDHPMLLVVLEGTGEDDADLAARGDPTAYLLLDDPRRSTDADVLRLLGTRRCRKRPDVALDERPNRVG